MHIDIVSDVVCPWCYIGKRRLEKALALRPEIEAEITLRLPVNLARQIQRRIAVASGRVKLQGRALQSYERAAA